MVWETETKPGMCAYADVEGSLVRTAKAKASKGSPFERAGGAGGALESYSPAGERAWRFDYHDDEHHLHHDFTLMPNGNILAIAWARARSEEALEKGRRPEGIFGDWLFYTRIVEIAPTYPEGGEIVWTWDAWDHLVQDVDAGKPSYGAISENPHLIDVNYHRPPASPLKPRPDAVGGKARMKVPRIGEADWMHANSIDYDPSTGLILLSVHGFDEIWVIDKNSPERGLVSRFGNSQAYGKGGAEDQVLFRQHDASWIDEGHPGAGNILLFNNGLPSRDGKSSSRIMELKLNELGSGGPGGELVWQFDGALQKDVFYAMRMSGAQRLPNGNTLICHGPKGRIFQVSKDGKIVWEYWNEFGREGPESGSPRHSSSVMPLFKVRMYSPDTF